MRELKFRAWDKREGCWVGGWSLRPDGFWTDVSGAHLQDGVCVAFANWRRQEETPHVVIMQYTGFKDKSGKEVYEGDILELNCLGWGNTYKAKAVIEYQNFRWWFHMVGKPENVEWNPLDAKWEPECEIIGNIYKHPELLSNT